MSKNTKEQNERHQKIIMDMLKLPENRECADCTAKGPRWASANIGVFICIRCAGIHRNLGTHYSFVRSCTLDTWSPEHVKNVQRMGNAKAKAIWEARVPPGINKPDENDDVRIVEKWIRDKYVKALYKSRDGQPVEEQDEPEEDKPRKREGKRNGRHRRDSDEDDDEPSPRASSRPTSASATKPAPTPAPSRVTTTTVPAPQPKPVTHAPQSTSASSSSLIDFDLGSSEPVAPVQTPARPSTAPPSSTTAHYNNNSGNNYNMGYAQPMPQSNSNGDLMALQPEPQTNQMKDSILSLFQQPGAGAAGGAAPSPYRSAYPAPQPAYGMPHTMYNNPAMAGRPQMYGNGVPQRGPYPNQGYYPNPAMNPAMAPHTTMPYGYNNFNNPNIR